MRLFVDGYILWSFFVNSIMMIKIFKDNHIVLDPKKKYETADMDSFKITENSSKIFKVVNIGVIGRGDLQYLLFYCMVERFIFSFQ